MTRRRSQQPELRPVYVQPMFDWRQRTAKRDWSRAAYHGARHRPKPGDFDPLWLRLGLRMQLIESRAGWVVSNPIYDQVLRRSPEHDPSLPGVGWLDEVYRSYKNRSLVTLPGARDVIASSLEAAPRTEQPETAPSLSTDSQGDPAQQQLFSAEEAA